MSVKIGTTISGTYKDGPGLTHQSHLIYAANAAVWWLFTVTSASDSTGSPGTHVIKSYVSSSSDLSTATWTAKTDSPNLDASSANTVAQLEGGRNLACLYWNNAAGSNKDIVLIVAEMQNIDKLTGGNSYNGLQRAVVTATTITWDSWGGWVTGNWNNLASHVFQSGDVLARTADGYLQVAGAYLHSEVDCSVISSLDPDTSDSYTTGNISATGTVANALAIVTVMSNQTRLKVGMALSQEVSDWNTNRYPKVNSIDSSVQVTMNATATGPGNGPLRWWQFTCGSNRNQLKTPIIDDTMANECITYGLAKLASNGMLLVYDTGAGTPPNFSDLNSMKANQTQGQGFWPSTTDGTGFKVVFGSAVTNDIQDWCLVGVDTTHIYCTRRTANTTLATRVYSTGGDSWSALGNQPPALTGKVIKATGGVMGVTDGTDMWIFVIDSTDNAIKYVKYSVGAGTWGSWTLLESVDSTAKYMSGYPVAGNNSAGLIYAVTNGGNFDTYVSTLSPLALPPSMDWMHKQPDILTKRIKVDIVSSGSQPGKGLN